MLWRGNTEEDPALKGEDKQVNKESLDRSETTQQKFKEDVNTLRETLNLLKEKRDDIGEMTLEVKDTPVSVEEQPMPEIGDGKAVETAQQAVIEQALKDVREEALQKEHQKEREEQLAREQKEAEEAQRRAAEKKREAQRLRQIKIDAERRAAARRKQEMAESGVANAMESGEVKPHEAFEQKGEDIMRQRMLDFERRRQADQDRLLAQQRKILEQQRKMLAEEERKAEQQKKREAELELKRARQLELQKKREADLERKRERQKLIEEERRLQRERREKADEEIRQIRAEQEAQRREERKARARKIKAERAEKAELRKQKKIAKHTAELGGGLVNVHGVTVKTEIAPVAAFSWKDLLGIVTRKEKQAAGSEEELKALLEEQERKTEEARLVAARLAELRRTKRQNSELGIKYRQFVQFCDEKKKPLLVAFACLLVLLVGVAGVINFFTVFEYSYNGKALGYVNNRDNVLQITDLVQKALTKDKNIKVVIDARNDVSFRRVPDFQHNLTVDTSDDVLRRLTYMGDLNVKAYGIYIDGKKIGAVRDKDTAANVLQDIKDKYSSSKSGTEIQEAVIVEDIQIRRTNTDLGDIQSESQMVETLCTSGNKETLHKVVVGETLADIARDYGTTEKQLKEDNAGIDPKRLDVGSTLVIKTKGPVMTVKITEVRTYDKTVEYETVKKKDKEMYEGYSEIEQEGKNGKNTLTDKTVSVNGEVVEKQNLETIVVKKPQKKIIRVGTKERPPTVGSGKFIWPAKEGTYTVTSEFKWRWGRMHEGIDLGCRSGNVVMAADGGTVTYAGYMGGYGNLVIIDHQNGMESYYGHNSSLTVSTGDKVYQGQQIAYSGNTGNSTGPHIHFGIKVNGSFENPRNYLP